MSRSPIHQATCVIAISFLAAAGIIGCTSGTSTEDARANADPRAVGFLLDAEQAFERGAFTLALALSDSAEVYAPELVDIHFFRGRVYTEMNQLEVSNAAYGVALDADPEYQGVRFNLGINQAREGKWREAIDWYVQEEAKFPSTSLYTELGRAYARLGEADSARWAYTEAIALDDSNTTAYMWMGQLEEEVGDLEKALQVSETALAMQPQNLDYQYIVGTLLFRLGRVDAAEPYLRAVADARAWHHGAQYNMGQILVRQDNEAEAEFYLTRADSAQQLQQRINEAQNAINREPDMLDRWLELAQVLRNGGKTQQAMEAYKVAVSLQPENLFLQANLAQLMMENGDLYDAERRYVSILRLDSTLADVWFNLGVLYANNGNAEGARSAWQRTQRLRPNHPAVRQYLRQLDT
ncbi:MAG: tetratricopeptide repeat protein [Bacteroidota bacterium]